MPSPSILVVTLGGTITMTAAADGTIVPTLDADDLVRSVPGLAGLAEIETVSLMTRPGASLTPADIAGVAKCLGDGFARGSAGAVVIQGTDTIEETAFLLDLLMPAGHPVVVTGAMRGATAPGADGAANLLAAVAVASAPQAAGRGVLVVLNDEIHAARFVQKSHTFLPSAFQSPISGPVGYVAEGEPRLHALLPPFPRLELVDPAGLVFPPVALLTTVLGDDGRLLGSVEAAGYRGLVVEAMGAGHVPAMQVDMLAELAARMPVLLASRVHAGRGLTRTYGFAGSETDLLGRGLISAGSLSGKKARLLLMVLLGLGYDGPGIAAAFERLDRACAL